MGISWSDAGHNDQPAFEALPRTSRGIIHSEPRVEYRAQYFVWLPDTRTLIELARLCDLVPKNENVLQHPHLFKIGLPVRGTQNGELHTRRCISVPRSRAAVDGAYEHSALIYGLWRGLSGVQDRPPIIQDCGKLDLAAYERIRPRESIHHPLSLT